MDLLHESVPTSAEGSLQVRSGTTALLQAGRDGGVEFLLKRGDGWRVERLESDRISEIWLAILRLIVRFQN